MSKHAFLLPVLFLLMAVPAKAQPSPGSHIPVITSPDGHPLKATDLSPGLRVLLNSEPKQYINMAQQKNAAAERLLLITNINPNNSPPYPPLDSIAFTYSNGRGSSFDYFRLEYDYYNRPDFGFTKDGWKHSSIMSFDSAVNYYDGGVPQINLMHARTYDPITGKVIKDLVNEGSYEIDYTYDLAYNLVMVTTLTWNSAIMALDTSSREYISYHGSNYDIKDSLVYVSHGVTGPTFNFDIVNNAAGDMLQLRFYSIGYTPPKLSSVYNNSYNNFGQLVNSSYAVYVGTNPSPINNFMDSFVYTTGMITEHDYYIWSTGLNKWILDSKEKRHLNADALPDSIFKARYPAPGVVDSTFETWTYDNAYYPIRHQAYQTNPVYPAGESHYYYTLPTLNAANLKAASKDITVYPNPAKDALHVRGALAGQYIIVSSAGQSIAQGTLTANGTIDVSELPPGMYQLLLRDDKGLVHCASVVK